ncbi:futalosine hydrolase [Sphingobacterium shayense]|uniref:futalosine hydrolase n=1 Tax=Sphingobacterium shayense TaxID=626343 RepID=UPI001553D552|nr:futalosine hydrolase [Sphingobacterium shayense]NQD71145.1 futalosine hydrolase [Sphingobacterium shayense]
MDILVVAATREEIYPSIAFLEEHNIRFLIGGVGMVQTAFSLGVALQQNPTDLIVQVGIGGILDSKAILGEIYQIQHDEIFEFGAQDHGDFLPMESLGFAKTLFSESIPSGVILPKVKSARGITVNTVHGNVDSIQKLQARYSTPLIESMEGVAAFYAAAQTQTAVLQYRAVSNYIEPRNRKNWLIGPAIEKLNAFLRQLLTDLV